MHMLPVLLILSSVLCIFAQTMPLPWTRVLAPAAPSMQGNDVLIAQNLLKKDVSVGSLFDVTGVFDDATVKALSTFQQENALQVTGQLDSISAATLLNLYSSDGIQDTGFSAASLGYKYKFSVPVHTNRSIETVGTLFDSNNNVLMTFPVRTHGHRDDNGNWGWPDFGSQPPDFGLNQFSSSGNTVTGIVEIDLNSPEPNAQEYGPWPVNRVVKGLQGNAAWMLPSIRDGILVHTGNWTTADSVWDPLTMSMPNSAGCLHAHPNDIERIYKTLVSIGVQVNDNTFSGKNYPYKPQGVAVIYSVDA